MSSKNTSVSITGTVEDLVPPSNGGPYKGKLGDTKVKLWAEVIEDWDTREEVPNAALAAARDGLSGTFTGYSRMESFTKDGKEMSFRATYLTGFEPEGEADSVETPSPDAPPSASNNHVASRLLQIADELASLGSKLGETKE